MSIYKNNDEVYFAVNLIADGPLPGLCSTHKLQLTIVGAGRNGQVVQIPDGSRPIFSLEMRPIGQVSYNTSNKWLLSEHTRLMISAIPVGEAIGSAASWIRENSGTAQAVPVTWPGGIEGVHLHHYFTWCGDGNNPFSGSQWATNTELITNLLGESTDLIAGFRSTPTIPAPSVLSAQKRPVNNILESLNSIKL